MNAPFSVAQAPSTGTTAGSRTVRTIKVTKPQGDQAITVQLGYEQNYKLDLSGIANEKITLVHIGEKLIILFDNKSTVTVEPFFDAMNAPLSNVTIEASGRDFTSNEFASAFPITTDQSVLTAAGVAGVAGSPASGANFHGPSVDPLNTPEPLPLLGQEELPNWTITQLPGVPPAVAAESQSNQLLSFSGSASGVVEEESLNQEVIQQPSDSGNGIEEENSAAGDDHDTISDHTVTGQAVEISLATLAAGGDLPLAFELVDVTADADPENNFVHDTNGARVTSFGADVSYVFVNPTMIQGWADGRLIFTLELIDSANGTFRFTLNDQIDHPTHTVDAGSVSNGALEETLGLDLSSLVGGHDGSGDPIVLPNSNMFTVAVIDDTPVARVQMFEAAGLFVDETVPSGDEAADPFTYGVPLGVATQTLAFSFGSNPGADGLGSSIHTTLEIVGGDGADSGLTTTDGTAIRLFLNGGIIEGRVDGSGAVAFALATNDFGQVTAAQYLALHHPNSNSANDAVNLAGKVNAVVTVTDGDGDVATSSVGIGGSILFVDDAPAAAADTNWVQQNGPDSSGNVLVDQAHNGAPAGSFADVGDNAGSDQLGSIAWSGEANGTIAGLYGTLTVDANGNYTYTLDNTNAAVQQLGNSDSITETFTYTMTDGDGDHSSATLTMTIFGSDHGVTITNLTPAADGGEASVNEANLPDGSSPDGAALTQTGTFNISTPDGLDDLTVGGQPVITDGIFTATSFTTPLGNTLSIIAFDAGTGEISYTYTLDVDAPHPGVQGANGLFEDFAVVLTDVDGTTANDMLSINIVDDVPAAKNDADSVTEDSALTADGNVITGVGGSDANGSDGVADTAGADGIASIAWTGASAGVVTGLHGTLTIDAAGNYSYALNNGDAAVQSLSNGESLNETFTYTIADADGDSSVATLTITINGSDDGVTITNLMPAADGGDASVDEANLSDGSAPNAAALTQTGTFNISATDGIDDLFVGGHAIITDGVFTATSFLTTLGNTLAFTGFDIGTGQITYAYTLNDNEAHASGLDANSLFEDFAVVLTDVDGSTANDTLSVNIIDDVPTAVADTNWVKEGTDLVATGNVFQNLAHPGAPSGSFADHADIPGADAMVHWIGENGGSLTGFYGTVSATSDGTYTYVLDGTNPTVIALGNGQTLTETFGYWIQDGDGDMSFSSVTITIFGNDGGVSITNLTPESQSGDVVVNEDDLLASRGAGESAGSDTSKESTTQTGTFNVSAPDGLDDLSVGGNAVITNGVFTATSFTTTLGNTLAITAFNAGTGEITYSYTLNDNEIHPAVQGTNSLFENFAVVLTDVDGSTANDTLSVNIVDDMPAANPVTKSLVASGHNTNIMLILDVSGSMDDPSGLPGLSRLDVMKASVNELLEQYGQLGNVSVRIVTFESNASESGSTWMTIDQAKAVIAGLNADGSTDYDAAVAAAMNAFADSGKIVGAANVAYFMSDGEPNEDNGTGSDGIVGGEITTWQNFLDANSIDSFALGMGTGVTQSALNPLAYDGVTHTDMSAIVVTDMSQLTSVLVGTVSSTGGNLLSDGVLPNSFGADGGYIKSVTVDGTTYTYDPTGTGSIGVSGTNHGLFDTSANVETINLSSGGTFSLDMDDGTYNYVAPADVPAGFNDVILYALIDNDGDIANNSLTVVVSTQDHNPIVRDDTVITSTSGVSGNDQIVIPEWALLFNDSDVEGHIVTVTGVSGAVDGSVSRASGNVTFTEESSGSEDGGSFIYTGSANGLTNTGIVTIDRDQEGENTLDGTGLGEILLGRSGNANTINGNGGNDVLIGGTLSDLLNGGTGNDLMVGGAGSDTYVVDSANDQILENAGEGTDTVQASFSYSLAGLANVENLTLTGSGAFNGTGNSLDNVLTGNSGNNVLDGGAGDDTLNGGAGTDTLIGGSGNDTYVVDSATDTITESSGQGTDTVQSSVTFSLVAIANVENLTLTGSANINGTGNGLDNVLTGNSGNNTLTGGAGNDTLGGGGGNDSYVFGLIDGTDTIIDSGGTDAIVILTGGSTLTSLNFLDDNTTNDAGNLVITFNGQQITVIDHYDGSAIENVSFNNATFAGYSLGSGTYALGLDESNPMNGTNGNEIIAGDSGTDTIDGSGGNDLLFGNGGNDTMTGGTGADLLFGGSGSDRFVFASGSGGTTAATMDVIGDYTKGAVGTGDVIDYSSSLAIGGTNAAATPSQASINASTGVATFDGGSGTTLADAISDIAARINVGGTNSGEFALFQVNGTGDFHVFISDGTSGVSSGDMVIQLFGMTTIGSIQLNSGDLTIAA